MSRHTHICIRKHVCIYSIVMYIHIDAHLYVHMYTYMNINMVMRMQMYVYVYTHTKNVYIHVHTYVFQYIHNMCMYVCTYLIAYAFSFCILSHGLPAHLASQEPSRSTSSGAAGELGPPADGPCPSTGAAPGCPWVVGATYHQYDPEDPDILYYLFINKLAPNNMMDKRPSA